MSNTLNLLTPIWVAPAEWDIEVLDTQTNSLVVPRTGLYLTQQSDLDALVAYNAATAHPVVFLNMPPMGFKDRRVINPNAYYPTPALLAEMIGATQQLVASVAAAALSHGAWAPTTAYAAGAAVQAPDGTTISRNANGTSRASFDAAEKALWTPVATTAGSIEDLALKAMYGREFRLEDQGAAGDGVTADDAAIAATLAKMRAGDRLVLTEGKTFAHSGVIDLATAGIHLIGGTLKALDSAHCALYLTGTGVTVTGVTKVVNQTVRTNTQDSHSFVLRGANQILSHPIASGAGGVGIFAFGATDYLIDAPRVFNTGADGIHNTGASTRGVIRSPRVYLAGDDHIAVVSYQGDSAPTTDIQIIDPICYCTGQTNGRGIAVVGGEDISVNNYKVVDSFGAGIYVNVETAFAARDIKRVRFTRGELTRPNTGWPSGTQHGAVLVGNADVTRTVSDVVIEDIKVVDAGTSIGTGAGRVITLQKTSTAAISGVFVDRLRVRGTLTQNLLSNTAGLATSSVSNVDYGQLATASLPTAAHAIVGATYFDTTLNVPGFCNGSAWLQAQGTTDPLFAVLAADASNATITVSPLTGMAPPVVAGATYVLTAHVIYEASQTGDIKVSFTIPGSATLNWAGVGLGSSATTAAGSFNSNAVVGGSNTGTYGGAAIGTKQYLVITGLLITAAAGGTVQMNFGQNTLDGSNATIVHANSWMRLVRVA